MSRRSNISYADRDRQYLHPQQYIMPYTEINNFPNDSSDMDLGLTMINFSQDDKNYILKMFNDKGVIKTFKKKISSIKTK